MQRPGIALGRLEDAFHDMRCVNGNESDRGTGWTVFEARERSVRRWSESCSLLIRTLEYWIWAWLPRGLLVPTLHLPICSGSRPPFQISICWTKENSLSY